MQHQLQYKIGSKHLSFSERGMLLSGAEICIICGPLTTEVNAEPIIDLSLVAVNILKGHWQHLTFDWGPEVIDLTGES